MTQPGSTVQPAVSWWPRTERIGVISSTYGWNVTVQGSTPPALSMTGTLSATSKERYTRAPAPSMIGTLSAQAIAKPIVRGTNIANATSVTIPSHAVGDLIVLFVRQSDGTMPTKPSASGTVPAWADIDSSATGSYGTCRTAQFIATATNHTTGTWTGADGIIATVLRGIYGSSPIGGHAIGIASFDSDLGKAPAVSMSQTDGTSVLLHFFGWGDGGDPITAIGSAPTGYTQLAAQTWSDVVGVCLDTKNDTTSDGAVNQTSTDLCYNCGATVEVRAW